MWSSSDPRNVVYKRAKILILRQVLGGYGNPGIGYAESKYIWSITTDYDDYPEIDEWDPLWKWTRVPE